MRSLSSVSKLILGWLILAVIAPYAITTLIEGRIKPLRGVTVTASGERWIEADPALAISTLFTKPVRREASLDFYLPVSGAEEVGLLVRGTVKHEVRVDGTALPELSSQFWSINRAPFAAGVRHIQLILPKGMRHSERALELLWTRDYVYPQQIKNDDIYATPISVGTVRLNTAASLLAAFTRLNLMLLPVVALLAWLLQRTSLRTHRGHIFLIALMLLIFFVRANGILYQVQEGIHPDERVVENSAQQIRQGNFRPQFFFYSQGFMYLTALLEKLGFWITGFAWPRHLGSRILSAVFSTLSCLVLYSIAKQAFGRRTALLATVLFGFSFMPVILGHYGIIEPTMVFFFLLAFRQLLQIDKTSTWSFAKAGMLAGLAVGIKQTAAIILIPFACIYLYEFRKNIFAAATLRKLAAWSASAAGLYFIISPYNLLAFPKFLSTQLWQVRSLSGQEASSIFFRGTKPGVTLILEYLNDGLGYAFLAVAAVGMVLIWRRSPRTAWLIVPLAIVYFAICSLVRTPPYHYPLLLCPLFAILAALAIDSIPARLKIAAPVVVLLLIMSPSLVKVIRLQTIVAGKDTRKRSVQWCYRNLPPRAKLDTEFFGPRFFLPIFKPYQVPLRRLHSWEEHVSRRGPEYYVMDSTTSDVFFDPPHYPLEAGWYQGVQKGKLVQKFTGDRLAMYNPDITIYRVSDTAARFTFSKQGH